MHPARREARAPRAWRALGAALGLAGALGCSQPATQLVVLVDSDYAIPTELAQVRARILDADGEELSTADFALAPAERPPTETEFHVPFSFAVVPRGDDPARRVVIELEGQDPFGATVVRRRAATGFVEGNRLLLPMFLLRACALSRVTCPSGQTCTERGCEPEAVDPATLLRVRPGHEVRFGLDAGPQDAGLDAPLDAGGDAGTLDAGPDAGDAAQPPLDAGADAGPCAVADLCCAEPVCADWSCDRSSPCTAFCPDDTSCTLSCDPGATCTMRAGRGASGVLTCRSGGACTLACDGSAVCQMGCRTAASCLLRCGGSTVCGFTECPGPLPMGVDCGGGVFVCNLPCP